MSEETSKYTWEKGPSPTDVKSLPQNNWPLQHESAENFLSNGLKEMQDRQTKYDEAGGERSMQRTVELFTILTGQPMSETDGWKFMQLLKLVRSQYNGYRKDDYVDLAAYAALAGESASKESGA